MMIKRFGAEALGTFIIVLCSGCHVCDRLSSWRR